MIGGRRVCWPFRRGVTIGAAILAFSLAGLYSAAGRAASTEVVGVSAWVADSCRFAEVPQVALAEASGSWTVRFQCTRTTPYRLELGPGEHFDAGQASRRMRRSAAAAGVAYSLVAAPARGEGSGARLNSATFTATIAPPDFAEAAAGIYTDTIVLALRHAVSGETLAFTELTLRLRADMSSAQ